MSFPIQRLRRLRATPALRRLVAETALRPQQLIQPIFVQPGSDRVDPIPTLAGIATHTVDRVVTHARELQARGIGGVLLFGVPSKKDARGSEAWSPDGAVQRACAAIRDAVPDLVVMTDVCLCAYTDHGHCGVLRGDAPKHFSKSSVEAHGATLLTLPDRAPVVDNDSTCDLLAQVAVSHAQAGAQIVAPSDMMDGRVDAIREALESANYADVAIMSYAAKYASAFYGPFRSAQHSTPQAGDRKTYQMDLHNAREALREVGADLDEGADIIMVKPAMAYLDIIRQLRDRIDAPIAAYQVSGEYAMIKQAGVAGLLDADAALYESLIAIRRAGADMIITYAAGEIAGRLL